VSAVPDLQEGLATVAECINRTDREIIDEIDDTIPNGGDVSGFVFSHGDKQLAAFSNPESHFFRLQYSYDVTERVAIMQRIEDESTRLPDDPSEEFEIDIEVTEADQQSAQQRVAQINSTRDAEKKQEVKSKLVQMLSDPGCGYHIFEELNGPHGFKLITKLFVYESGFRTSEFDDACQTLVSVGAFPREFLETIYNIELDLEGSSDEGSADRTASESRGFQ